jgi:hypothetical protein
MHEDIAPSAKLIAHSNVVNVTRNDVDGKTMLSVIIDNTIRVAAKENASCIVEAPYDCHTAKNTVVCQQFGGALDTVFDIAEEIECGKIDKILVYETDIIIKESLCNVGKVNVSGDIFINIVYRSDNMLLQKSMSIPFYEEQMPDGEISLEDKAVSEAVIKSAKLVVMNDGTALRAELQVGIKTEIIKEYHVEVVTDAYSNKNELELTAGKTAYDMYCYCKSFTDTVGKVISLPEKASAINEIAVTLNHKNHIANFTAHNDMMTAEGAFSVTLLYIDADEKLASVILEVPYSISAKCGKLMDWHNVDGVCAVSDVVCRRRRDREVELTAKLHFTSKVSGLEVIYFISDIRIGEAKKPNAAGISYYIASGGESLWDVAKNLSSTPDHIAEQNAGVGERMKDGQKIMLFRRIVV